MESSDKPPSYRIRRERLCTSLKLWTVRSRGRIVTAFYSKSEACNWVYQQEQRMVK